MLRRWRGSGAAGISSAAGSVIGGKAKATFFLVRLCSRKNKKQKKPMCIWNNGELLYLGLSVSVFCFYGLYATLSSQFLLARVCVCVDACSFVFLFSSFRPFESVPFIFYSSADCPPAVLSASDGTLFSACLLIFSTAAGKQLFKIFHWGAANFIRNFSLHLSYCTGFFFFSTCHRMCNKKKITYCHGFIVNVMSCFFSF